MTKNVNDLGTSELLYYITVFNKNFEYKENINKIIDKRLKYLYEFTDKETELIKKVEIKKMNLRGDNIDNYLFSDNLTAKNKLDIIYDMYEKNEIGKLTLDELSIAINLMTTLLEKYYQKKSKANNKNNLLLYSLHYEISNNIVNDLAENYCLILDTKSDYKRFRQIYRNNYLSNSEEKKEIETIIKK